MRLQPTFKPLNLQFFAEEPSAEPATTPATTPTPTTAPAATPTLTLDDVTKALDTRLARAEHSQARSMAEQYGMSEAEVKAMFEQAKAAKAKALPEEAQKQIKEATDRANSRLIAAEVKAIGSELGLIDSAAALVLMDSADVKVDENGNVTGAKEALEALKTTKPYLFKVAEAAPTGQKANVGGKVTGENPTITKEQFAKMSLTQMAELQAKNPALYKTLKGE